MLMHGAHLVILIGTLFISSLMVMKLFINLEARKKEAKKPVKSVDNLTLIPMDVIITTPLLSTTLASTLRLTSKSAKESAAAFEKPEELDIDTRYLSPVQIKEELDKYVIGQGIAKKKLAVAIANHYKRVNQKKTRTLIKKANIMLVGPTGSGKTLLVSKLAKMMGVPFVHQDATSFTQAGYIGRNVEEMISDLVRAAPYPRAAENGVIFIDEIDKLASHYHTASRDVGGKGVQQALLKLIESEYVHVSGYGEFNIKNVLFIFGGAFQGLLDQKSDNMGAGGIRWKSMGFHADIKSDLQLEEAEAAQSFGQIRPKDLVEFGLIPEFIGRIPVIAVLEPLTEEQLVQVLTEPDDSLVKEYEELFYLDEVDIVFEPEALLQVANAAFKLKTGARGLRSIMEDVLLDTMYSMKSIPGVYKVKITGSYTEKIIKSMKD